MGGQTRLGEADVGAIDEELWGVALRQKMLRSSSTKKKGGKDSKGDDDRWDRVQKDAKPFVSPFHWAPFLAHGSCRGVHPPGISEDDEFGEIGDNLKFEQHYDEFDRNDGFVDTKIVKLAKKGAKATQDVVRQPAKDVANLVGERRDQLKVQLQEKAEIIKAQVETKKSELKAQVEVKKLKIAAKKVEKKAEFHQKMGAKKAAFKSALKNAPGQAKERMIKELKDRDERKRNGALEAASPTKKKKVKKVKKSSPIKGGGGKKKAAMYQVKDVKDGDEEDGSDGSDDGDSSDDNDDDSDFERKDHSSVTALRKKRGVDRRGGGEEDGGSKACAIM
jgi:hypothetical protein